MCAPETSLDAHARELRQKIYSAASKSLDALLELLKSDKVASRTRANAHLTLVKMANNDSHEVAKLRLERERMLQEAEMARLDRGAKERTAALAPGGPQVIVRLDSEAVNRARLAAGEQERLRTGSTRTSASSGGPRKLCEDRRERS